MMAQDTSNDVSWAIGMFFFLHSFNIFYWLLLGQPTTVTDDDASQPATSSPPYDDDDDKDKRVGRTMKAQDTSFDVSWAIGMFFFLLIIRFLY
jgi:hypothetical protein